MGISLKEAMLEFIGKITSSVLFVMRISLKEAMLEFYCSDSYMNTKTVLMIFPSKNEYPPDPTFFVVWPLLWAVSKSLLLAVVYKRKLDGTRVKQQKKAGIWLQVLHLFITIIHQY